MRISESAAARSGTLLCAAALAAASLAGCARGVARPPVPAQAPSPGSPRSPGAASQARPALDPEEEITPGELGSIPDPIQGQSPVRPGSPAREPLEATPGGSGAPSTEIAAPRPSFTWRVQIFAAQDLGLADRKAKEAEERLGAKSHLEFESPYYKVRLGDYASEEEAQSLRERAIQTGYPGAFRVRCAPDTTQYEN